MSQSARPDCRDRIHSIFRKPGCPMCRAARTAEETHLRWLHMETYSSTPLMKLLEDHPYCWRHGQ
jgi:hypothetical protein